MASAQRAKGPYIASEGAIGQLTSHQYQGAGPGHSHMGVTGSRGRTQVPAFPGVGREVVQHEVTQGAVEVLACGR